MSDIFYAWGRPLTQGTDPVLKRLDHTWVTIFEEDVDPTEQPDPPEDWNPPDGYWYCWGRVHNVASHQISMQSGSIDIANAISPQNTPAVPLGTKQWKASQTSGSIEFYGLDGVCHQVANQVLCATATQTTEPQRVQDALGYSLSTFFYGTYGLNTEVWQDLVAAHLKDLKLAGDDFLPIMKRIVPEADQSDLLDIRTQAQARLADIRRWRETHDREHFAIVGRSNFKALLAALKVLGEEVFLELFPLVDLDAMEDMHWIRPDMPAG